MEEYLKVKYGVGEGKTGPSSSNPRREGEAPAHVELDVRTGAEPMETTEEGRRGQKRGASESPAPAPSPHGLLLQLRSRSRQCVVGGFRPTLGRHTYHHWLRQWRERKLSRRGLNPRAQAFEPFAVPEWH